MVRNSLNEINEKLFLSFMNSDNSNSIESVLQEQRVFPPSDDFASKSRISSFSRYLELSELAQSDPNKFWGDAAREELHWFKSFDTVLDLSLIHI